MLRAVLAYLAGGLRGAGLLLAHFFSMGRIKVSPEQNLKEKRGKK